MTISIKTQRVYQVTNPDTGEVICETTDHAEALAAEGNRLAAAARERAAAEARA